MQLGGISLKLSPPIGVTTSAFIWKLGILTPPTLLSIVMMAAYFLTPIYTSSEKRQLISDRIKGPLVAAFRSPLMKALDRSVETLGPWIVTSSVTFIKSVNHSSIKPCLTAKLYPGRDRFEFDQGHVTKNQSITVLVLFRESQGIMEGVISISSNIHSKHVNA